MSKTVSSRTNTARRKEQLYTGPFFDQIRKRKKKGRDAKIFWTGLDGGTGIGKTHGATAMGYVLDTAPTVNVAGLDLRFRPEKCTVYGPEWMRLYDKVQSGSYILGDEWTSEGDARRANSHKNVQMSYQWAMRRYREVMSAIILPSKADLDSRLQRLADYWILVEERGKAIIHEVRIGKYDDELWFEPLQEWSWPNMDGDPVIQWLDHAKEVRSEEDEGKQFFKRQEMEELVSQARMEGQTEARLEFVQRCLDRGLTQTETGDLLGVKQPRVSQLKTEAEERGITPATA
jgi:hypothetical protein